MTKILVHLQLPKQLRMAAMLTLLGMFANGCGVRGQADRTIEPAEPVATAEPAEPAAPAEPAEPATPAPPVEAGEVVQRMTEVVSGQQLQFLVQTPAGVKPKEGWPLLLFLHGYGECGTDIDKVRKHGPPKLLSQFEELRGCVIVSPQCPPNSWWRVDALKAVVEQVMAARGDVDRSRIYVTGLSMGGYGIWSMISRYPDFFAAAVPICGGGDPFRLPANRPPRKIGIENEFDPQGLGRAHRLPIWTFHGARDRSVPIGETEMLVEILLDAGSENVIFTAYDELGHVEAWQKAYRDPGLWKWLFAQRSAAGR